MINKGTQRVIGRKPFFSSVSKLLIEGHVNDVHVFIVDKFKIDLVCIDRAEVILGLRGCRGAQTFVVLDFKALFIGLLFKPGLKLWDCEE